MKKKFMLFLLVLTLCISSMLPVYASKYQGDIIDEADLLSSSEERSIEQKLEEVANAWQVNVVVLYALDTDGKSPTPYAEDYYDARYSEDGIMLMISMAERDWVISGSGFAINAFTDAGRGYIADVIIPLLSSGDYYEAADTFADLCDEFLETAREGRPYDRNYMPKEPFEVGAAIVIALVIGIIVALITVLVMRGKLKSVRLKGSASDYVRQGSFVVPRYGQLLLHRHVDRRLKPQNNGGGGSTTHRASSGRIHSSSGGKF